MQWDGIQKYIISSSSIIKELALLVIIINREHVGWRHGAAAFWLAARSPEVHYLLGLFSLLRGILQQKPPAAVGYRLDRRLRTRAGMRGDGTRWAVRFMRAKTLAGLFFNGLRIISESQAKLPNVAKLVTEPSRCSRSAFQSKCTVQVFFWVPPTLRTVIIIRLISTLTEMNGSLVSLSAVKRHILLGPNLDQRRVLTEFVILLLILLKFLVTILRHQSDREWKRFRLFFLLSVLWNHWSHVWFFFLHLFELD